MDNLFSLAKILFAFGIVSVIAESVVSSDKFKSYTRFFIGIAVLLTVVTQIKGIDVSLSDFFPTEIIISASEFSALDNAVNNYSAGKLEEIIKNELISKYGIKESISVRLRTDSGTSRVFITVPFSDDLPEKSDISEALSEKLGVQSDRVFIYFSEAVNGTK